MIKLYSKRWSIAKGWHWKYERDCELDTGPRWLNVFREDEPDIEFVLSEKKPK